MAINNNPSNLLLSTTVLTAAYIERSAWSGHIPFAFWLMEAMQPRTFVELGVHTGVSYLAFLQAVAHLNLDISATGIDTWQGDAHSGYYSNEVFLTFPGIIILFMAAFQS